MSDKSASMATFVKQLDARVSGLDVKDISDLISLLQQDRRGQVKPFTERQIETIMANCLYSNAQSKMDTDVMENILAKLQDPARISVMHQLGRKQLQMFILQLSKRQTAELVQHMAPFFTKYTHHFVSSLSVDQKAEVFGEIMPCALNWACEQGTVAALLAALYEPPDIATAIEFYGHNQKISRSGKAAAVAAAAAAPKTPKPSSRSGRDKKDKDRSASRSKSRSALKAPRKPHKDPPPEDEVSSEAGSQAGSSSSSSGDEQEDAAEHVDEISAR